MYRHEVPLYDELLQIVHDVDKEVVMADGLNIEKLPIRHELERHGAIRLAFPEEMHSIQRLFAVMGMQPVGYYDLTLANLPLHATAFRPVSEKELAQNPFRVFTSLLRFDLLPAEVREKAEQVARKRHLFKPKLLDLLGRAEESKQLSEADEEALITESLGIFRWHTETEVSISDYNKLKHEHPVVADIVCFPTAHINHLTPRTLDIDRVQRTMQQRGLPAKGQIEGPRRRACDVLLRQTSFKALEEKILFRSAAGESLIPGVHTARFGEVEQRGAAMTPKGRNAYDQTMDLVQSKGLAPNGEHNHLLEEIFEDAIPDNWSDLLRHQLVYFRYSPRKTGPMAHLGRKTVQDLIDENLVEYEPITYEDFLPLSAAGIFSSNLSTKSDDSGPRCYSCSYTARSELEEALGCPILEEFQLYEAMQAESIQACARALNVDIIGLESGS